MPDLSIARCRPSAVRSLRALFLEELNAQFRYEATHLRRWATSYLVRLDRRSIGYGSIRHYDGNRGTVFDFYLLPPFRSYGLDALRAVIRAADADVLECQSNDRFFASLVPHLAGEVSTDTILFASGQSNRLSSDSTFRRRRRADRVFEHTAEPVGDFVIEVSGEVIATGGFLLHYNEPYADLFMEVRPDARRRGYGSFLIQELVTECYLAGRVPAARTGIDNIASQRTLSRGGLRECGRMLRASLK